MAEPPAKLSRYVIGIDLGTTNSALAYVDRRSGPASKTVRHLLVPQLVAPGDVRPRPLLPSFVYLAGEHELPSGAIRLPFGEQHPFVVGEFAREQGARVPGRLVASSKSWLCHERVDRRAPILPWNGAPDAPRISPVEAGARVLAHFRDAWDHEIAKGDPSKAFLAQEVILCVPASFEAVARRLTLDAANAMGLERPILLEEPQAALYAWISAHEGSLREGATAPGSLILVVDVGGGTTDFALVRVADDGGFERTAVSDHLLLGGDNMDLALARYLEPRLRQGGEELDGRDWSALRFACRAAKEALLAEDGPERATVTLAGAGAQLVGGARSTELTRADALVLAVEGFFPEVALDDTTPGRSHVGLQEIGLPFVADPAITRHMGAFLRRHAGADAGGEDAGADLARPTAVLFNGGVMTNALVRRRVLDVLEQWMGARPVELEAQGLDLAVAKGAAYYGLVRRERGQRIRGGLGRAYYVGIDTGSREPVPLCLTPRKLEAEKPVAVKLGVSLQTNVPVQFPFFFCSSRGDGPGDLVVDATFETEGHEGEFHELPPLVTVLKGGARRSSQRKEIPVELEARLTELGVLELACHAADGSDRRWDLELSVRSAAKAQPGDEASGTGTDDGKKADPEKVARAGEIIAAAFASDGDPHGPLSRVGRDLEELLAEKREAWPIVLCRALFEVLFEHRDARRRSPEHEARFLNLAALLLRPGFGAALDDFRVAQLWKHVAIAGLVHPKVDACRLEWWIFHRRIAGGLGKGHHEQLLHAIRDDLLGKPGRRISRQEQAELWRLAASLEHIPAARKEELGSELARLIERGEGPPRWGIWAIGRFGTRLPQYGPLNETVPGTRVARWLEKLLPKIGETEPGDREKAIFAIVQLGRLTGDPGRDVPQVLREAAARSLESLGASALDVRPLLEYVPAARPEQRLFYGDTVPAGLVLRVS